MMAHKEFKEGLKRISNGKRAYAELSLKQSIKIQRLAKRIFGDMNMMEFYSLVNNYPGLGNRELDDLPF